MSTMVNMKAPSWLRGLVAPFRKNATAAILLGIATLACASLLMFVSGYLISKTALPSTTLFKVMVAIALVQVFGIGRPILRYFERLISHDWVFRVTSSLRRMLFSSVESQAGKPDALRSTGKYLELLSDDIGHLQNLYLRVAFPTIIGIALFVVSVVFAGFFSWQAALAVFACGLIAAVLIPVSALLVSVPMRRKAKEIRSREYARLADDILGAADWSFARRSGEAAQSHIAAGRNVLDADAAIRRIARVADLAVRIVLGCGLIVLIVAAAHSLQGDAESANYIAAFALGFFPIIETLSLLPSALSDFTNHSDSIARLDEVILDERQPSSSSDPNRRTSSDRNYAIELSGVDYAYPNASANTLFSLNLSVYPGQKVAILGPSGAGKSTLAALVRGEIEPTSGAVSLVGDDGTRTDARVASSVCYIPQSAFIFDQTLRENLAMAKPDASDEELVAALFKVGLAGKLAALPDGLDTRVGETGVGFSGGEAHRLALARALLMDKPVVLLDEPFTALDPEMERLLLDELIEAFDGKTLIVITHHLARIERFDRVILMQDGSVTLNGEPSELMRDNAWFRRLVSFDRGVFPDD